MILNDESRTRITVTMTLTEDPTDSTVELKIDDTWHACTWQDTPTQVGTGWRQEARTTGYFAGPVATPDGATVLDLGTHDTETRISWAGTDTIVAKAPSITVRA